MRRTCLIACLGLAALPVWADGKSGFDRDHKPLDESAAATVVADAAPDSTTRFIESNVLETLYHELAHALIDKMGLEVFGPEEFAADFLSAYLIDRLHDEATTRLLVRDVARAYEQDGASDRWEGTSDAMWDMHGKPMQRYYNLVCLYYGADPEGRANALGDFGLPEARAETCAEEYELARYSWGAVLEELAEGAPAETLVLDWVLDAESHLARYVAAEVVALNEIVALPEPVVVSVIPCGEVNAFYDPGRSEILICTELSDHFAAFAP